MWIYNYTDEMYHAGTKGMKWGRRRYQYENGSLTPAGRARYGSGSVEDRIASRYEQTRRRRFGEEERSVSSSVSRDRIDQIVSDARNKKSNESGLSSRNSANSSYDWNSASKGNRDLLNEALNQTSSSGYKNKTVEKVMNDMRRHDAVRQAKDARMEARQQELERVRQDRKDAAEQAKRDKAEYKEQRKQDKADQKAQDRVDAEKRKLNAENSRYAKDGEQRAADNAKAHEDRVNAYAEKRDAANAKYEAKREAANAKYEAKQSKKEAKAAEKAAKEEAAQKREEETGAPRYYTDKQAEKYKQTQEVNQNGGKAKKKGKAADNDGADGDGGEQPAKKKFEFGEEQMRLTADITKGASKVTRTASDAYNQELKQRARNAMDLSEMTDQQMQSEIKRYLLEKQYKDIFADSRYDMSVGERRIKTILETAPVVLDTASSALTIASQIKKFMG